ncbi:MAG TPA: hypothetical protein VGC98_02450 [Thermoleophilaceae bacterium]
MRRAAGLEDMTQGQPARGAWPSERLARWGDGDYWERRIDAAIAAAEPGECNRCVTVAHQELALALHSVTGPGSGANFHTWAVWGSKKAGTTIRQEDVPWFRPVAAGAGALLAAAGSASLRCPPDRRRRRAGAGGAVGASAAHWYAGSLLTRAAGRILEGNITVLDDIGRQTGRFVSTFLRAESRTDSNLEQFLARLRPGSARDGGQDLLRVAYSSYLAAARHPDADSRDELMLLGNLNAILHEHWRLDPFIDESLPRPFRRLVTHDLLDVAIGTEHLRIGEDVPTSPTPYPITLTTIENPALRAFLDGPGGWDRSPDTTDGSGAGDWTDIGDRMNYIVDLFRTRQHDPHLFTPPYPTDERDRILAAG